MKEAEKKGGRGKKKNLKAQMPQGLSGFRVIKMTTPKISVELQSIASGRRGRRKKKVEIKNHWVKMSQWKEPQKNWLKNMGFLNALSAEKKEDGERGPEKLDQNDQAFSTAEEMAESAKINVIKVITLELLVKMIIS
jgi:hypothetical protein